MTVHPALPLLAAAALQGLVPRRWRGPLALAAAAGSLGAAAALPARAAQHLAVLGFDLHVMSVDPLSRVFALVFAGMACLGTLYALHVRRAAEQAATLVYAGSALGVVFAGDWMTLFLFWELMAVSSTAVIWHGGAGARGAGFRYVYLHLASGAFVLAGVLLLRAAGVEAVATVAGSPGSWLLLAGVAVNAAVPPLHAWLTDAYPRASVTGSVFLSAFTTKTAVYVLVRAFPGTEGLVWAGVAMALYGVVFAVLENDIRRLLGYHIVSQVGYMVAGVGLGTALALDGAAAHAFCHILYKSLLFMGAGAVIAATGRQKLTDLGGLAPRMKAVLVLYMIGAFSISGVPLFNGFISKSMIVSAAAEGGRPVVELLLTLASIGTFLHTGLKLPYFTFFGATRSSLEPRPIPWNMTGAMVLGAALCTALGVFPHWLYARLPLGAGYEPFTADHVASALQLLLGTGAAFALLLPQLAGERTISLDTDWLYRRPLPRILAAAVAAAARSGHALGGIGAGVAARAARLADDPVRALALLPAALGGRWRPAASEPPYDPDARRLPVGVTVFWAAVALAATALWIG